MKILVPIEDPLFAAVVVQFIHRHKWPENTELHLVHVLEPFLLERSRSAAFSRLLSQSESYVVNNARLMLESVENEIRKGSSLNISFELRSGAVLPEILAVARQQKVDLIVAGSHGRSGFNRFLLGSVSLALVADAPCPVLLVKPAEETIRLWEEVAPSALAESNISQFMQGPNTEEPAEKILVCVDDKEMSNRLSSFLVKHKWAHSAHFKLLSVVQPLRLANLMSAADLHMMQSEMLQSKKELLGVLALKLCENGTSVEAEVIEGDPKAAILQTAANWQADLIVMGAGGFGTEYKDKKRIGSVALAIMSKAACSVLFLQDCHNHEMNRYMSATAASLA
jgi:universal stress protein A